MPVFFLVINAKPREDNLEVKEVAGAYVSCYIVAETFDLAEEIALNCIEGKCWIPVSLDQGYEVSESDFMGDPGKLEVYKQVLIDKERYTFHTYESEE